MTKNEKLNPKDFIMMHYDSSQIDIFIFCNTAIVFVCFNFTRKKNERIFNKWCNDKYDFFLFIEDVIQYSVHRLFLSWLLVILMILIVSKSKEYLSLFHEKIHLF